MYPYCSAPKSPESGSSGYASTSYNGARNPSSSASSPARTEDNDDIYSPVCSDTQEDPEAVVANSEERAIAAEVETTEDNKEDSKANEFDIIAYLYDDNSYTNLMSATELNREEEAPPRQKHRRWNHCSFDDAIDDNEIHDIELEIVSSKAFEKNPMQPILTLLWSISKSHKDRSLCTLSTLLKIFKLTRSPGGGPSRPLPTLSNMWIISCRFVFHSGCTSARCWSSDEVSGGRVCFFGGGLVRGDVRLRI